MQILQIDFYHFFCYRLNLLGRVKVGFVAKVLLFLLFFSSLGVAQNRCEDVFIEVPGHERERVLEKLRNLLAGVLSNPQDIKHFLVNSQGILESRAFDRLLQIQVDPVGPTKKMGGGREAKLYLNRDELEGASEESLQNTMRQFLVGHPLHPYAKSPNYPDKPFVFKRAQLDAMEVVEKVKAKGDPSLLVVGPGGIGKTPLLIENLKSEILKHQNRQGVHLVLLQSTLHLRQMERQLRTMMHELTENNSGGRILNLNLQVWGDGDSSVPFNQLIEQNSVGILLSTIASFRGRFYESPTQNAEFLKDKLLSLNIDEVHHVGARLMRPILQSLTENGASFFTLGTTAVPVHPEVSLQGLFGNRSFWLNLDKENHHSLERPVSEVMAQYEESLVRGELTPLEQIYFLTPKDFSDAEDLFVLNSARRVLNPAYFPQVFGLIGPLYLRENSKSITVSGSIALADAVKIYLENSFPNKSFAVVHSKTLNHQLILSAFTRGEVDHLIVVEMLDEAFDMPELTTLIDLTPSASSRQIIQRMARPARLADDKTAVELALFIGANEDYLEEHLVLLDRLIESRKNPKLLRRAKSDVENGVMIPIETLSQKDLSELKKTLIDFRSRAKGRTESYLQYQLKRLDEFILKRDAENRSRGEFSASLLPQRSLSATPEERELANWLAHHRANSKKLNKIWYENLSEQAIEALKRTEEDGPKTKRKMEILAELDAFILGRRGMDRVLPSLGLNGSRSEQKLARQIQSVKKKAPLDRPWYEGLSFAAILELRRTGEDKVRDMFKREDWIRELDAFILSKKGEARVLPKILAEGESKSEDRLAKWVFAAKSNEKSEGVWYQGLSEPAISELKRTGEDQPLRRGQNAWIKKLDEFILSRSKEQKVMPSFFKSTPPDERKLAVAIANIKSRSRLSGKPWYQGLSKEAQEILLLHQYIDQIVE